MRHQTKRSKICQIVVLPKTGKTRPACMVYKTCCASENKKLYSDTKKSLFKFFRVIFWVSLQSLKFLVHLDTVGHISIFAVEIYCVFIEVVNQNR